MTLGPVCSKFCLTHSLKPAGLCAGHRYKGLFKNFCNHLWQKEEPSGRVRQLTTSSRDAPLKTIASFSRAAGDTRRCGGWETPGWAHPDVELFGFFPLGTTTTKHLYRVVSDDLMVLNTFLSPCLGPFLSVAVGQGFRSCSRVVHKRVPAPKSTWGLNGEGEVFRDEEHIAAPTEAEESIGPISLPALVFRSSNAPRSLTSPTPEVPASEISSCTLYCSVSAPHCQAF